MDPISMSAVTSALAASPEMLAGSSGFLANAGNFLTSNAGTLASLGSGLGDIIGGLFGNSANAEEARKARKLALYMFKNQAQIRVNDLRKAGLNPILATGGLSSGGIPSLPMANYSNPFGSSASSAKTTADSLATLLGIKQLNANVAQTEANTALSLEKVHSQRIQNAMDIIRKSNLSEKEQQELARGFLENSRLYNTIGSEMEDRASKPSPDRRRIMAEFAPAISLVNAGNPMSLVLKMLAGLGYTDAMVNAQDHRANPRRYGENRISISNKNISRHSYWVDDERVFSNYY